MGEEMSSSHSSLQPREPQTKPDHTASLPMLKKPTQPGTDTRSSTEVTGRFLLFVVFKTSLQRMTAKGKEPEGKGTTSLAEGIRTGGQYPKPAPHCPGGSLPSPLLPPQPCWVQAGCQYLSLPGWNSESRDGLRRCGCMIDPGGRWEAKSLE